MECPTLNCQWRPSEADSDRRSFLSLMIWWAQLGCVIAASLCPHWQLKSFDGRNLPSACNARH